MAGKQGRWDLNPDHLAPNPPLEFHSLPERSEGSKVEQNYTVPSRKSFSTAARMAKLQVNSISRESARSLNKACATGPGPHAHPEPGCLLSQLLPQQPLPRYNEAGGVEGPLVFSYTAHTHTGF